MKNKYIIAIVLILFVAVILVQYKIYHVSKNNSVTADSGKILGIKDNPANVSLKELKIDNLIKIPIRKSKVKDPLIYAKNYILFEPSSGYVLVEKDSHVQVPVASTTKIMTAIIVLEKYKLDDVITISNNAASQIGSDINLRRDEKLTVKDLMYALLIQSANDAASALSENVPGGTTEFVRTMNEKAQFLGMKDTKFKDPAGLDDTGLSTAFDLAIAFSYATKNDLFNKIIGTEEYTITSTDGKWSHNLSNSNRMIKGDEPLYYSPVIGGKTGFTPDAGHCLVAVANNNGHKLISVILHTIEEKADSSAKESRKLLQWGFDNFEF